MNVIVEGSNQPTYGNQFASKLTEEQWQDVERRWKNGERVKLLANEYGITDAAVYSHFRYPKVKAARRLAKTQGVTVGAAAMRLARASNREQTLNRILDREWERLDVEDKLKAIDFVIS